MGTDADNPGDAGLRAEAYSRRLSNRHQPREAGAQRLSSEVRSRLTPHLGFDPGVARIHTGPEVAAASEAVHAEAFTVGRDVFFGAGRFDPVSERGTRLLVHELVHVGQQTPAAREPLLARQPSEDAGGGPHGGGEQLHREQQEAAPSMRFALPLAQPSASTGPPPSETATEEQGAAAGAPRAGSSASADTQQVADRVYELFKQEIILGRERGGIRTRRR